MKYDKEEKDILDAYESGHLKISKPSKKEIERIKKAEKILFKKILVCNDIKVASSGTP